MLSLGGIEWDDWMKDNVLVIIVRDLLGTIRKTVPFNDMKVIIEC